MDNAAVDNLASMTLEYLAALQGASGTMTLLDRCRVHKAMQTLLYKLSTHPIVVYSAGGSRATLEAHDLTPISRVCEMAAVVLGMDPRARYALLYGELQFSTGLFQKVVQHVCDISLDVRAISFQLVTSQ